MGWCWRAGRGSCAKRGPHRARAAFHAPPGLHLLTKSARAASAPGAGVARAPLGWCWRAGRRSCAKMGPQTPPPHLPCAARGASPHELTSRSERAWRGGRAGAGGGGGGGSLTKHKLSPNPPATRINPKAYTLNRAASRRRPRGLAPLDTRAALDTRAGAVARCKHSRWKGGAAGAGDQRG